jgi:predicted ATPase
MTLLDEALQIVQRTDERWFEAELYRHKGQLLLRQGRTQAAEELYHRALAIARKQRAKLWELRAAVNLARLFRDHGRRGEARPEEPARKSAQAASMSAGRQRRQSANHLAHCRFSR